MLTTPVYLLDRTDSGSVRERFGFWGLKISPALLDGQCSSYFDGICIIVWQESDD